MSNTSESSKASWMDITNESVHTSDDRDIGDIEAISKDLIVVKHGFVKVHRYYIPVSKVEGWDGHVVWLKIKEDEVKKNYERDRTLIQAISIFKAIPILPLINTLQHTSQRCK
jgi:hypothetical protein